jgi:hypothetical protein
MAEEIENTEVEENLEDDVDLYDLLKIKKPESEDDGYNDLEDEQEVELAKQDKMEKKLSAKMDDMQKKFENTLVRERVSKFQETADDLQKDLFKTIAGDVKDVESLDKALKLVDDRSKKMRADAEKYRAQLEKQAEAEVSAAWGTGPMGTPTPHTADYEEELYKRVRAGDDQAAFELIIGDDWPSL